MFYNIFTSYNLLITSYCQLPRWRLEPMTGGVMPCCNATSRPPWPSVRWCESQSYALPWEVSSINKRSFAIFSQYSTFREQRVSMESTLNRRNTYAKLCYPKQILWKFSLTPWVMFPGAAAPPGPSPALAPAWRRPWWPGPAPSSAYTSDTSRCRQSGLCI